MERAPALELEPQAVVEDLVDPARVPLLEVRVSEVPLLVPRGALLQDYVSDQGAQDVVEVQRERSLPVGEVACSLPPAQEPLVEQRLPLCRGDGEVQVWQAAGVALWVEVFLSVQVQLGAPRQVRLVRQVLPAHVLEFEELLVPVAPEVGHV